MGKRGLFLPAGVSVALSLTGRDGTRALGRAYQLKVTKGEDCYRKTLAFFEI